MDTAPTEIYTLSLHDALPIWGLRIDMALPHHATEGGLYVWSRTSEAVVQVEMTKGGVEVVAPQQPDRKSTRLNSSHSQISYAVFCLKKKKTKSNNETIQDSQQ